MKTVIDWASLVERVSPKNVPDVEYRFSNNRSFVALTVYDGSSYVPDDPDEPTPPSVTWQGGEVTWQGVPVDW